jgi:hypothetical protein
VLFVVTERGVGFDSMVLALIGDEDQPLDPPFAVPR